MSDNEGECEGEKVFSYKMHKLIISEAGVGGSNPQENNGEEGSFGY